MPCMHYNRQRVLFLIQKWEIVGDFSISDFSVAREPSALATVFFPAISTPRRSEQWRSASGLFFGAPGWTHHWVVELGSHLTSRCIFGIVSGTWECLVVGPSKHWVCRTGLHKDLCPPQAKVASTLLDPHEDALARRLVHHLCNMY